MAHLKKDPRSRKKRQEVFLFNLEKWANITQACRVSKLSRRTIYNWIDSDAVFKVEYDQSLKIAIDVLEDEAKRRAYNGTKEPIYQSGKKVGTVTRYSDTLMIFLLKNLKKDTYKDVVHQQVSAPDGGPVQSETKTVIISNVDYKQLPTSALEAIIAARIQEQD